MTSHLYGLVAATCLLGVLLPATAAETDRFRCEFQKKEDTFQVVAPKPGAETFRIRSATGIGSGTITCREGTWPETVTVLYVGMKYLESLTVTGNGVTLTGVLRRGENPSVYHFNERGEALADAKGAAYRLAIESLKDAGIQVKVTIPLAARAAKEWKFDWIDAFRR